MNDDQQRPRPSSKQSSHHSNSNRKARNNSQTRKQRAYRRKQRYQTHSDDMFQNFVGKSASVATNVAYVATSGALSAISIAKDTALASSEKAREIAEKGKSMLDDENLFFIHDDDDDDDGAPEAEWSYRSNDVHENDLNADNARKKKKPRKRKLHRRRPNIQVDDLDMDEQEEYENIHTNIEQNNNILSLPPTNENEVWIGKDLEQSRTKNRKIKLKQRRQQPRSRTQTEHRRYESSKSKYTSKETMHNERRDVKNKSDTKFDHSNPYNHRQSRTSRKKGVSNKGNETKDDRTKNAPFKMEDIGDWIVDTADEAIAQTGEFVDSFVENEVFKYDIDIQTKRKSKKLSYLKDKLSEQVSNALGINYKGQDNNFWNDQYTNEENSESNHDHSSAETPKNKSNKSLNNKKPAFFEKDKTILSVLFGRIPGKGSKTQKVTIFTIFYIFSMKRCC